jgi:predicted anti-sigma-YlaC factor YlaD
MAERTFNPNSPACGQWETLLAGALDGLLKPEDDTAFNAHRSVCPACAALYDEACKGREWLEFLSPEPEVPAGLLARILAHTGPGHEAGYGLATAGGSVLPARPVFIPAWQRPGMVARVQRFAEPRLLMTAAMAFFSIAMTLSLAGVRLSSLRLADLRPSSFAGAARSFLERRLTMASTPIIRYYDNSRLVYEVQTRMRELRRSTQGEGEGQSKDLRQKPQDAAPGEPNQASRPTNGHSQANPSQQPVHPATEPTLNNSDYLETSLTFQHRSSTPATMTRCWGPGPALSGGSLEEIRERSTVWTA